MSDDKKVIFSMSQMGDRRTGEWMMGIAQDTNEPIELRKKALFWLGQSGSVDAGELRSLYASIDDRELLHEGLVVAGRAAGSEQQKSDREAAQGARG